MSNTWNDERYKKYITDCKEDMVSEGIVDAGQTFDVVMSILECNPGIEEYLKSVGVMDVVGKVADDVCI